MIVIIGSGISGLSLSYFLSESGIKNIVIDFRSDVGKSPRSTTLISEKIFKFFDFIKSEDAIKSFDVANFWYDNEKIFTIKSKNKMYIFDYKELERKIFQNIDKNFSNFLFSEKVVDVNLSKNILFTNKRKLKFEFLVDASGTYAFLANKFNLFKLRKIFNSFEIFGKFKKRLEDVNLFFDKKFSKKKFGWYIDLNDAYALVGAIDTKLKIDKFREFVNNFDISKIFYEYSHPILFGKLKKYSLENSLIVGEAAGLVKPFSLGGITYGIISSYLAYRSIIDNDPESYDKKIKRVFNKSLFFGKVVDKIVRKKFFAKLIRYFGVNKIVKNLDPDFIYAI